MDASTPLWKAHDISQQLQDKLEELPNVERAFVHVDHETTHTPVCVSCFRLRRLLLRSRNIARQCEWLYPCVLQIFLRVVG